MPLAIVDGTEAAVGTTEWSLPRDAAFDSAQPQTTIGHYEVMLSLGTLAAGDVFELRLYEKATAADSQGLVDSWQFTGVQAKPRPKIAVGMLGRGWDITLKKIAGTDRTIHWSVRSIT